MHELAAGAEGFRVPCVACAAVFAVPAGYVRRRCPACFTIHDVIVDEEGTLFRRRRVVETPHTVRALFVRREQRGPGALSDIERAVVIWWTGMHTDYTTDDAVIPCAVLVNSS